MKNRHFAALLILLLTVSLLAGCSARAIDARLEHAEDVIEHKLDRAEDAVEDALRGTFAPGTTALTPEEAQLIALEHAGFTADQVQQLRTEYETDDRVPHYDVSFREGTREYEYEIHPETGAILSWDKDA